MNEIHADPFALPKHLKDIEEAAKDYTVPCAEMCAELYEVQEQKKALEEREKKLKGFVKKFKDRGDFQHGPYVLNVSERKGQERLDRKTLEAKLIDVMGMEAAYELLGVCTKVGEPSVVVSVKKLNQSSGDLSGGSAGEGL